MREIAERRGLRDLLDEAARPAGRPRPIRAVVAALEEAAPAQGIPFRRMHSGAGHDTQNIAQIARTAMVFARSKDGRSHTPEEFTAVDDAVAAIRVLAATLHRLAY